jgi:high-affinity Fe2+/Pb2+ permease
VSATLGLGVAFFGGINDPNSNFAVLGIVLLFVSFASLFYVSVTVLSLEEAD